MSPFSSPQSYVQSIHLIPRIALCISFQRIDTINMQWSLLTNIHYFKIHVARENLSGPTEHYLSPRNGFLARVGRSWNEDLMIGLDRIQKYRGGSEADVLETFFLLFFFWASQMLAPLLIDYQ